MKQGARGNHDRRWRRCWAGCVLGGVVATAGAQTIDPGERELTRQRERERALREQQERRPDVRLESGAGREQERLPDNETPCFPIRELRLSGDMAHEFAWAVRAAELPAAGPCLGAGGIDVLMKRVQNAIIARGYITTRVLAPPQDLNNGVLTLAVVPGRIEQVRYAEGADARAHWSNALPVRSGELLNLRDIEQGLENLQRVPTATADIRIAPADGEGAAPGESDLIVAWQQRSPLRVNFGVDDAGSQATGQLQANATLSVDHGLARNDLFYLNLGHDAFNGRGRGTSSWTAHYDIPYGYWLLGATASGYEYHQTVAGDRQDYRYSGSSRNAELRLARLLFRNARSKFGAYARGWWRESDNFIDDTEIEVQRRRNAGWEAGLTYKRFIGRAIVDANLSYRRGTGAFGALPAPEQAFGEGTSRMKLIAAELQLTAPFQVGAQSLRYTGSWRGQWNRTPLVPQDRFAIGGRYTVRGFDGEAALSGERGWLWRNELALSLGGPHELYLGADVGHVGGPSVAWQSGDRLVGGVIGLRGRWRRLSWDGFVGAPISAPRGFPGAYTVTGFNLAWSY